MFGVNKQKEVYEPFKIIFEGKNFIVGLVEDSDNRLLDYQKIDELVSSGYEILSMYGTYYPKAVLKKPISLKSELIGKTIVEQKSEVVN